MKTINRPQLLTRGQFKDAVFLMDHGKCVFFQQRDVNAHHIMGRKLFQDGGYLENGCVVGSQHHWE